MPGIIQNQTEKYRESSVIRFAQEAKSQHDMDIDKKKIVLAEPIKAFGTFEVPVKLHPQVTATLKVKVEEC